MEIYKSEKGEMHFKHSPEKTAYYKSLERDAVYYAVMEILRQVELSEYCGSKIFTYDHTANSWEF